MYFFVAGLVQHCSIGGAIYHIRYAKKHRRFEMSGTVRVEFRNKYGRIRRTHMSASPLFSQFDVYFFYLYHYGTDGTKERGTRARVAENGVPFHRSARH